MKSCTRLLTALLLGSGFSAMAADTPWYLWQYQIDGVVSSATTCAHTMTGTWKQVSGPYQDAGCQHPGLPLL